MPTVMFFCDATGRVIETHAEQSPEWDLQPGTLLWEALGIDEAEMDALLSRVPPGGAHSLTGPHGQPLILRLIPFPRSLSPVGGYLAALTLTALTLAAPPAVNTPVQSASTLDYAVFNAVFNDVQDAILLTDDAFRILAANRKAHALYASGEECLDGSALPRILHHADEVRVLAAARALKSGTSWRGSLTTLGPDGQETPARITVRCLSVGEVRLYQFMLGDLRRRMALERDLAKSRMQVADMNTALKQVLRNVEEERQELKDGLVQQVREEVLPTVERIVQEDSHLVRQAYRSALEEKIADMVETSPDADSLFTLLTPREMDICRLIQQSWQGRAIAEQLGISFETLQTHRKNIRRKLGLKNGPVSLSAFLQQQPPL